MEVELSALEKTRNQAPAAPRHLTWAVGQVVMSGHFCANEMRFQVQVDHRPFEVI